MQKPRKPLIYKGKGYVITPLFWGFLHILFGGEGANCVMYTTIKHKPQSPVIFQ